MSWMVVLLTRSGFDVFSKGRECCTLNVCCLCCCCYCRHDLLFFLPASLRWCKPFFFNLSDGAKMQNVANHAPTGNPMESAVADDSVSLCTLSTCLYRYLCGPFLVFLVECRSGLFLRSFRTASSKPRAAGSPANVLD